jgi:predicted DNA-binding transcriptional regulator AlpA
MTPQTELLTREETAARLDIKPCTLDKWRARRKSRRAVPLAFVKIGGRVRYRASDIEKFLQLRTVTPGEKRRRSAA